MADLRNFYRLSSAAGALAISLAIGAFPAHAWRPNSGCSSLDAGYPLGSDLRQM